MDSNSLENYINNGVELLNKRVPGWTGRIDLEKLDISSNTECVVGQLFGNSFHGYVELGLVDAQEASLHNVEIHGFDASLLGEPYKMVENTYKLLTKLWKEKILLILQEELDNKSIS